MDDFFDGLEQGGKSSVQDDRSKDQCTQILCPAVSQRMLAVGPASGDFRADDRDHGGKGI